MTGDEQEAFSAYVQQCSQVLLRTAYLLTGGDAALAEDLLQTALVKTLGAWNSIRDRGQLDAYVRRVMVTTLTSWRRRRWYAEQPIGSVVDQAVADRSVEIDEHDRLRRALVGLPVRQRAAVVLRYYGDLSEVDTAAMLGCTVGTVKSQTARGLAKLRRHLDVEQPDQAQVGRPGGRTQRRGAGATRGGHDAAD